MERIIQWLTDKFQHPLSLLFFVLGAVLIILGISNDLNLPGLNQIIPNSDFRYISVAIGCVSCLLSILIYYNPPREASEKLSKEPNKQFQLIPKEFSLTFLERREALSKQQEAILKYIVNNIYFGQSVSQDTLEKVFNNYSKSELFYRLEHLCLLNFLEKQRIGTNDSGADRYSYRISKEYSLALGKNFEDIRVRQQPHPNDK